MPYPEQQVDSWSRAEGLPRKREVVNATAATTLTAAQAGALVLWNAAAGFTITLPAITAETIGIWFEFAVATTVTSSNHKLITGDAADFLLGEVLTYTTATASPAGFAFNGSTHIACTMNGTTTGGIIGTKLKVTAISATQWVIEGAIVGSGTIATPAATS